MRVSTWIQLEERGAAQNDAAARFKDRFAAIMRWFDADPGWIQSNTLRARRLFWRARA
ncbi:hypothetical protein SAMD00023378_1467 [Ralstonia sp. NT80]|nr:hypothetical protein C404_22210 [Ralstonia sp. AU12-08]GAQ27784.1 hypothetical protein SAMD00023378_1467 [Ralstonia sp. NT80]